jgi:hypothetical protein
MGFCPACWGISLCVQRVLPVPWSGFDLINAFNAWKRSEDAGRIFVAAPDGTIIKQTTGLSWRQEVSAQVFEEAAVDLGHALAAYGRARTGTRGNRRVGFPKRKRKGRCRDSFRLRNKRQKGGGHLIRVGDGHPRTVTLPRIGTVRVHDDTRRLRRLLRPVEQVHPETGERTLVSLPRSCTPPSAGTAPAGTSASMSRPLTYIQRDATRGLPALASPVAHQEGIP